MPASAYSAAMAPQPCRVLGRDLKPFCLGHHLLSQRLGLDWIDSADFLLAVLLCAHSYEDGLQLLRSGRILVALESWRRQLRPRWWGRCKQIDFTNGQLVFGEYIKEGYSRPKLWQYQDGGLELSAPWENLLKVRLVGAGFSESAVLNKYLPLAWWDYYTVLELRQADRIVDPRQWRKIFVDEEDLERFKVEAN